MFLMIKNPFVFHLYIKICFRDIIISIFLVFILWLNCEGKLRELVVLPNRVQFQIHPLSDVKVGRNHAILRKISRRAHLH